MTLETLGRLLVGLALFLLVVGGLLILMGRLGLVKLPGDILIRRGNVTVFFPIVSAILLSVLLTLLLNLFWWLWRR